MNEEAVEKVLKKIAGVKLHNKSKYDFKKLVGAVQCGTDRMRPCVVTSLRFDMAGIFLLEKKRYRKMVE